VWVTTSQRFEAFQIARPLHNKLDRVIPNPSIQVEQFVLSLPPFSVDRLRHL
jgi:hypothetical protein